MKDFVKIYERNLWLFLKWNCTVSKVLFCSERKVTVCFCKPILVTPNIVILWWVNLDRGVPKLGRYLSVWRHSRDRGEKSFFNDLSVLYKRRNTYELSMISSISEPKWTKSLVSWYCNRTGAINLIEFLLFFTRRTGIESRTRISASLWTSLLLPSSDVAVILTRKTHYLRCAIVREIAQWLT